MAICGSDVQYNLIQVEQNEDQPSNPETASFDEYRIFSQMMRELHWAPVKRQSNNGGSAKRS
ncbi:MAG: hypothetical protein ACFB14_28835 [Leptolyngbyaceae cyanobacterium]